MSRSNIAEEIINCAAFLLSKIKPSEWNEKNRILTKEVSRMAGPLSYDNSPYTREIVDCFAPDHPARIIAVMKAAQIGFSTTVIEAAIGWIISQNPGPILYTVGHELLLKDTMKKIDSMIDNSGIRHLIFNQDKRSRKTKSGDTDLMKEFLNGYLKLGIVNPKTLRNISMMYGFIDDWEGVKGSSKQAGSNRKMIEQRFAAFADVMKLAYISSPELMATSNIYPVYKLGDQRKYHLPCPKCEKFIKLEWSIPSEKHETVMCGMRWDKDPVSGLLIPETVRYRCQKCEQDFDDSNKMELMRMGHWEPTATASEPGYTSFHISALYGSGFMYGWTRYVRDYMEAHPENQAPDEDLRKTFYNLCLGLPYEPSVGSIKASQLMANIRKYKVGVVPEQQSIEDGNGKIVLITLAADLGGLMRGYNSQTHDDVRLDWELVAWSESGASYSFDQGSIGTFTPAFMGKKDETRIMWTYDSSKPNNVWREFDQIARKFYEVDTGRKPMGVSITGIDTGFSEHHAFNYIDKSNFTVIGLKGDKDHKYTTFGDNSANWRESPRPRLFLVKVSKVKDQLAQRINLRWDKYSKDPQPSGFMNFPQPADGKYDPTNYFSHFESEERKADPKTGNFLWQKKTSNAQNHFWDVNCYSMVLIDILMEQVARELAKVNPAKWKNVTWPQFCEWVLTQVV